MEPRESDLVGGRAKPRVTIEALTLLDRFPAFLGRSQVPLPATTTHDPEAATLGVECEATADREVLDGLVSLERRVTEDAGGIHLVRIWAPGGRGARRRSPLPLEPGG